MRYLEPVYFPGRPRTHYKEELELFVTYQEVFVNLSISPSIPYWFPPEFCELLPTVVGQNGQEMYSYGLNHSLPPFPAKETSQWLSLYIYMVVIFRNKMHIRSQNWSQQLRFRRRHHRKWTFFVLATFETQTLIFNKDLIHEKKNAITMLNAVSYNDSVPAFWALVHLWSRFYTLQLNCIVWQLIEHLKTSHYKSWTRPSQEPPSAVGNGRFVTWFLWASVPHLSSLRISQLESCKLLY